MNGAEDTKQYILKTISDELIGIKTHGCGVGQVIDQRVHALEKCADETKYELREIKSMLNSKWAMLVVIGVVLSFFAGVQLWQEIIKLFVR